MAIKVGDRLPETKFRVMTSEGPAWKSTSEFFKGKKAVLFGVPGAFTSTCSNMHLPGFLQFKVRREVHALTGSFFVPVLVLDDGTAMNTPDDIVAWAEAHPVA